MRERVRERVREHRRSVRGGGGCEGCEGCGKAQNLPKETLNYPLYFPPYSTITTTVTTAQKKGASNSMLNTPHVLGNPLETISAGLYPMIYRRTITSSADITSRFDSKVFCDTRSPFSPFCLKSSLTTRLWRPGPWLCW